MTDTLLEKLDLSASRIRPYEGFIFLCGGPTDITSAQPISIRDAIYRELAKDENIERRIRVAEHYKDWANESTYRDLVSFEKHLAELSSVIVLVLESPGSLAELGLFSVIEQFQRKLLIFVETDHYQCDSFIRLGPIDFLEKIHSNTAECHRWMKEVGRKRIFCPETAETLQSELAEAVRERAAQPASERAFRATEWLDRVLLLCDLINLNSALTLREIRAFFERLGHSQTESELKQALFILDKVGFLTIEPKGDQRFYVSVEPRLFLKLHLRDDSFDIDRYRANVLAGYEKSDKKRFRAIQEARRRYAKR